AKEGGEKRERHTQIRAFPKDSIELVSQSLSGCRNCFCRQLFLSSRKVMIERAFRRSTLLEDLVQACRMIALCLHQFNSCSNDACPCSFCLQEILLYRLVELLFYYTDRSSRCQGSEVDIKLMQEQSQMSLLR